MKLEDAINLIDESTGSHLYSIYIPSKGKEYTFKPITTGQQKTLSKFSLDALEFNFGYENLKLAIFDSLCTSDEISSKELTHIDLICFLAGIRLNNISDPIELHCNCGSCDANFRVNVDLEKIIENCKTSEFNKFNFKFDHNGLNYNLIISEPSYKNLIELEEYIKQTQEFMNFEDSDVEDFRAINKPCIYINSVEIDGELIEDFKNLDFIDKLKFYNTLPPSVTYNDDNSILNLIITEFNLGKPEEVMNVIQCPNCEKILEGVTTNDSFFII